MICYNSVQFNRFRFDLKICLLNLMLLLNLTFLFIPGLDTVWCWMLLTQKVRCQEEEISWEKKKILEGNSSWENDVKNHVNKQFVSFLSPALLICAAWFMLPFWQSVSTMFPLKIDGYFDSITHVDRRQTKQFVKEICSSKKNLFHFKAALLVLLWTSYNDQNY